MAIRWFVGSIILIESHIENKKIKACAKTLIFRGFCFFGVGRVSNDRITWTALCTDSIREV